MKRFIHLLDPDAEIPKKITSIEVKFLEYKKYMPAYTKMKLLQMTELKT